MPASGDIYQYTLVQKLDGQTMENVIHFRSIAFNPTDAQLKASAEAWMALQKSVQCTAVDYVQVIIKRMTPVAFDEILYNPVSTLAGTIGSSANNTQIAVVITKRTGVAGTSHRGRMYIGGSPQAWGIDTISASGGPTALGTFAGSMLATFGEGGTDPTLVAGLYSRTIGGSTPFTVAGWQAITRWDPHLVYGAQRRRRLGVGI